MRGPPVHELPVRGPAESMGPREIPRHRREEARATGGVSTPLK